MRKAVHSELQRHTDAIMFGSDYAGCSQADHLDFAMSLAVSDDIRNSGARTLVIQNEDGQIEEPYSISAGLDYPGIGPIHANLSETHRATILAVNDDEALDAAFCLTRIEGIIPALESAHALGALPKIKFKPEDVVVLTISGRGDKDMETYIKYKLKNEK